jgi:TctA family transporter
VIDPQVILSALAMFAEPQVMFFLLLGAAIGFFVGLLPGLGATATLALLLPFTFTLEPAAAIALMVSMLAATSITGDFTAVLFGIPGESTSAALILDGHPMTKNGEAGRALGATVVSSAIGALVGGLALFLTLPFLRPFILKVGTPEIFMLTVLGACMVGALSGKKVLTGILAACIGFTLALVGLDPKSGVLRLSGGSAALYDGVPLIAATVGLFAVPELIEMARGGSISGDLGKKAFGGVMTGVRDAFRHWLLAVRCSLIAVLTGLLPGPGGAVSQWFAYGHALQSSKHPERFGKGSVEGVIGPGAANNAKDGGAFIPMIGFGIPGSVSAAVLLAGLVILGLSPGPEMMRDHADLTLFIIFALVAGNLVTTAFCLPLLRPIAKITNISSLVLVPMIVPLLIIASLAERGLFADALIALVFGLVGWLMMMLGWSRPALLIGLVLGARSERSLWLSNNLYGWDWLLRPGVIVTAVLAVLLVVAGRRGRRVQTARDKATGALDAEGEQPTAVPEAPDEEGSESWADRPVPQLVALLTVSAAFATVCVLSLQWPWKARLFPLVIAAVALACCVFLAGRALLSLRARSRDRGTVPAGGRWLVWSGETRLVLWLLAFHLAVYLVGLLPSAAVFILAYLLTEARLSVVRSVVGAVIPTAAIWLLFMYSLDVRLPAGILL